MNIGGSRPVWVGAPVFQMDKNRGQAKPSRAHGDIYKMVLVFFL